MSTVLYILTYTW